MSVFSLKPTTVERAIAPLRTMLEDLEEISETCTQKIERNHEHIDILQDANVRHDAERGKSGAVQKSLRAMLGEDDA